eukprot:107343_1
MEVLAPEFASPPSTPPCRPTNPNPDWIYTPEREEWDDKPSDLPIPDSPLARARLVPLSQRNNSPSLWERDVTPAPSSGAESSLSSDHHHLFLPDPQGLTPQFSLTPGFTFPMPNNLPNSDRAIAITQVGEISKLFSDEKVTKSLILKDFFFRILDPPHGFTNDGLVDVFSFAELIRDPNKFSDDAKILPVFTPQLDGSNVKTYFQEHWFNLKNFVEAFKNMSDDEDEGYYTLYDDFGERIDHFTPYGDKSSPEKVLEGLFFHLNRHGCKKIVYKKWIGDRPQEAIPSDDVIQKINANPCVQELMQYPRFTATLNDGLPRKDQTATSGNS